MIDLQEYIDDKLDGMDYEFKISRERMTAERDIFRDFINEAFDERPGNNFFRYREMITDLYDMSRDFADSHIDFAYEDLRNWLVSPDHDGEHYFAEVIKEGLVPMGRDFDFFQTIQAAQIEEQISAIDYADKSEFLTPVIAAMYMQNQGYEKVNEELLDKMGELIDTSNLSRSGLNNALNEAKEELGLEDKEVGKKTKDEKKKDKDIEK